jgi:hypothetical protein
MPPCDPPRKERCAELSAWIQEHSRFPRQGSDQPAERSLHYWFAAARHQVRDGKRSAVEAEMLESTIEGATFPSLTTNRIAAIAAFQSRTGRLPRRSAPAGSPEHKLGVALVSGIRPKISMGTITPDDLAALSRIPGAANVRTAPDQDEMLVALTAYAEKRGHMPPMSMRGTSEENRLAEWWRNNTRGNPETKIPRLRARHEALLALEAKYPRKADAHFETSLSLVEQFVADNGYLPPKYGPSPETVRLGAWLVGILEADNVSRSPEATSRLKALTQFPTQRESVWNENLEMLATYVTSHAGQLPSSWNDGKVFSWLTVQRRTFRQGKMSEARLQKLLTIPGLFRNGRRTAAAAA